MILRALSFLGRHAPPILAASIFAGLAIPALAAWCKPAIVPSVYILLAVSLVRLDWHAVMRSARRPGPSLVAVFWLLVAAPIIMTVAAGLLGLPPALKVGLVVMAAAPPIVSSVAFALLFRLDSAFAAVALAMSLLLTPLLLPSISLWLLGLDLDIGFVEFIARLFYLLGGSVAAAVIIRRLMGEDRLGRYACAIDGVSVLNLVVFAIAIMAGITDRILEDPGRIGLWIAAAFLANFSLQAFSGLAFAWLGTERALTLALMSGNRNCALLVAVLTGKAEFDTIMCLALAQLPIYVLPAALAPVYRRLLETNRR